ncbi:MULTISPECIES: transcriptional regulator LeuO [Yersiniaceae]|uniref:Transcriptional regulator LeuO n=2 Tax=Yersiniaceae TaxID=1903411 RepID=A0A2N5ERK4_9GAMM|nr:MULTISPECIES: transcriptional regulator LeuO [Yersiniaceae]MBS0968874.1 transcriptional regulator LeuO [Nissabacter archeti]PLR52491.1 transcriptional regulator LeuO [Chimaeribacter arupi]PLR53894.1 transcriptional regulator LeuO [Chimaeribacter arupi]
MSDTVLTLEQDIEHEIEKEVEEVQLRDFDLNLLTVFDAVMQAQNITRAAESLGMSQPAVSNAVARLKMMFNDELFVRYGRGIQPTVRARQLFGPVRQALQLVLNELPGAGFEPATSDRLISLSISSPLDIRLAPKIYNVVAEHAPNVQLRLTSCFDENIEHQLRYQDVEFFISYKTFESEMFCSDVLFKDEVVLVCSSAHPNIKTLSNRENYLKEHHAVVDFSRPGSFSSEFYSTAEARRAIVYQANDLSSAMNIVSQTEMITLAPRWLASEYMQMLNITLLPITWMENTMKCYLSWHKAADKDRAHQWLRNLLNQSKSSL